MLGYLDLISSRLGFLESVVASTLGGAPSFTCGLVGDPAHVSSKASLNPRAKEFVPGATDEVDLRLHELIGEQTDRAWRSSITTAECFACDTTIQTDLTMSKGVQCMIEHANALAAVGEAQSGVLLQLESELEHLHIYTHEEKRCHCRRYCHAIG